MHKPILISGNSNPRLAEQVAHHLGQALGQATVGRFSDGEIRIEILENVRGRDAFVIQSIHSLTQNDTLLELCLIVDALRRASVGTITAMIPYYGYARQDRRVHSGRVPISARVIADILTTVGVNRVLTVDLHADQIQGFFKIPVDNIYSMPVILQDFYEKFSENNNINNNHNICVVSPDVGGVVRARAFKELLPHATLAIIDKKRPAPNQAVVMQVIGDVENRDCVIIDDIVDTAKTLCQAATALKNQGAHSVRAYITHPVLSGDAVIEIQNSSLNELVVTDTIPLSAIAQDCKIIRQISIAEMIAQAINCLYRQGSLSSLHQSKLNTIIK